MKLRNIILSVISLIGIFSVDSVNAISPNELYVMLQSEKYDKRPYNRKSNMGEGMEIVEQVIDGYWRERFLINHDKKAAYELMDENLRLIFLSHKDIDWKSVETLEHSYNAYKYSAWYQSFGVYRFINGVAMVKWTIYPDGRYFMDEDGYGMEDNPESALYGYIDCEARVIIPFQALDYKSMENLRTKAEQLAKQSK